MRYLLGNFDSLHILSDTPLSCISLDSFLVFLFLFDFVSHFILFISLYIYYVGYFSVFSLHGRGLSTNPPSIFRLTIVKMEVLFLVLALFFWKIYVGIVEMGRSICVIDTVFKLFLCILDTEWEIDYLMWRCGKRHIQSQFEENLGVSSRSGEE